MAADRGDFGSRLRAAREARGVSIKDIAATTKISAFALEALERGDASRLPGGIFSRAFVRAYAREVGLDPEQTVREFMERFGEADEGDAADEHVRARPSAGGGPGNQHTGVRWLGLAVTVALVVVWIGVDRYFSRRAETPSAPARSARQAAAPAPVAPPLPKPQPIEPLTPAVEQTAAPAAPGHPAAPPASPSPVTESSRAGTVPAPQPDVAAAPPGAAAPGAPPTPSEQGAAAAPAVPPEQKAAPAALRIVLAPQAACWVSVNVDGQRLAGRTLQPGEKLELSADKSIVLTAGDAGALSYTVNEAPGRSLGPSGEAVTVVITVANYKTFVAGPPQL